MKGLDLSKFKKISSDNKCTTLQHPDGHTIKIALDVLKPEMRSELNKIPIHKASGGMVKKYADGTGDVTQNSDQQDQQKQSGPVVINVGAQAPQQQPIQSNPQPVSQAPLDIQPAPEMDNQPQVQQPQTAKPQDDSDENDQDQPDAPNAQPQQASKDNVDLPQIGASSPGELYPSKAALDPQSEYQQEFVQYKKAHEKEFADQDAAFDQDLKNGHITPETYHDLFAKKSTLGKIGTIFGLMVGGAGAGLAHQQNAMFQMMNNELQNDLNSQIKSKDNAQNFYRLNQSRILNDAQANLVGSQANLNKVDAHIRAKTFAQTQQNRTALHDLINQSQKYPVGSKEYNDAQNLLAAASLSVNLENQRLGDAAAAKLALLNYAPNNQQATDDNGGPVDYNKMNQLQRASQMKLPGAPSESDLANMTKEAASLEETSTLQKQFNDAYEALNKKALAGQLNPSDRDAYVKSLSGKLAKIAEGRYSNSASGLVESMLPGWKDFGTTRADKSKMNEDFFNILKSGTPTLNRFGVVRKNQPQNNSRTMNKDSAAIKWAKENPNDPRSAKILSIAGAK